LNTLPIRQVWIAALLLMAVSSSAVFAQDIGGSAPPAATSSIARVVVDLAAGAFDRTLPFDAPFFITGRSPVGTTHLDVQYAAVPVSGDLSTLVWLPPDGARWQPDMPSKAEDTFLVLVNGPLKPGREYRVRFVARGEGPEAVTRFADGRTAQKNYVSVDAGVLFAGDISIGALYVGANVYFRPINKDAPLRGAGAGQRLALTVGVTISSVADEDNRTRSDLFWHQSLVLGAGYRLTSSLRGGGGVLVFQQADLNPLVTQRSTAATWYASFSLDLDVLRGAAR
jgi:hypothetical protein